MKGWNRAALESKTKLPPQQESVPHAQPDKTPDISRSDEEQVMDWISIKPPAGSYVSYDRKQHSIHLPDGSEYQVTVRKVK